MSSKHERSGDSIPKKEKVNLLGGKGLNNRYDVIKRLGLRSDLDKTLVLFHLQKHYLQRQLTLDPTKSYKRYLQKDLKKLIPAMADHITTHYSQNPRRAEDIASAIILLIQHGMTDNEYKENTKFLKEWTLVWSAQLRATDRQTEK